MNEQLQKLMDALDKAWEECKAFLTEHMGEDGQLSADDAATYDKMEKKLEGIQANLERVKRTAALGDSLASPVTAPIRNAAGTTVRGGHGREFSDYLRGRVRNAMTLSPGESGGYLVPEGFEQTLVKALADVNILRQLASVVTYDARTRVAVETDAGVSAWVGEGAAIPESDPVFGQITFDAYKMARTVKVSLEELEDSFLNLEAYLAELFGRSHGILEEQAFIAGDGVGKPTGILANTGGAAVGVTAASPTAITFDELIDLYYSVPAAYRVNGAFLLSDTLMKNVRKLKGTDGQYIWSPAVAVGQPDTIFGKPVYASAAMPSVAAGAKVAAFGDFKQYRIADRSGRSVQRLNELYAGTGHVGFNCIQRVDGKLLLPTAVKVLQMAAGS
jgi:HK97 family phage major capsid protein